MAPLDRRRSTSSSTVLLAALFLLVTDVSAAVLGLDFGTLNLKATLVKHFEEQILIIGPRCGKEPLIWSGYR